MRLSLCTIFSLCFVTGIYSFIVVPEELPSILSIIFSNVPPVKKGTDSRVGFGFRLGPNADYQLQLEFGPQTNTQPLGPDANSTSSTSKKRRGTAVSKINNVKDNNKNSTSEKGLNTMTLNLNDDNHKLQHANQISDPTRKNAAFVTQLRQLYEIASNNTQN